MNRTCPGVHLLCSSVFDKSIYLYNKKTPGGDAGDALLRPWAAGRSLAGHSNYKLCSSAVVGLRQIIVSFIAVVGRGLASCYNGTFT